MLEYPYGNRLQLAVLHFAAEPEGGTMGTRDDANDVGYVAQTEIDGLDINDWNRRRIDEAFAAQAEELIREDIDLN